MTIYNVTYGAIGTPEFTMTPSSVDTVTFAENVSYVDIISDGSAAIWYTTGGGTPTVGGADCFYIPAVPAVDTAFAGSDVDSIKLISAGTPKLRVQKR